jgi:hypothetical protein
MGASTPSSSPDKGDRKRAVDSIPITNSATSNSPRGQGGRVPVPPEFDPARLAASIPDGKNYLISVELTIPCITYVHIYDDIYMYILRSGRLARVAKVWKRSGTCYGYILNSILQCVWPFANETKLTTTF